MFIYQFGRGHRPLLIAIYQKARNFLLPHNSTTAVIFSTINAQPAFRTYKVQQLSNEDQLEKIVAISGTGKERILLASNGKKKAKEEMKTEL